MFNENGLENLSFNFKPIFILKVKIFKKNINLLMTIFSNSHVQGCSSLSSIT